MNSIQEGSHIINMTTTSLACIMKSSIMFSPLPLSLIVISVGTPLSSTNILASSVPKSIYPRLSLFFLIF